RAGGGRAQAHVAAPGLPGARARAAADGALSRRGAGAGRARAATRQREGAAVSRVRVHGDRGLQPQSAGGYLDGAAAPVTLDHVRLATRAARGMVTSPHVAASQAGVAILQAGG